MNELLSELSQFCGTERYHASTFSTLNLTDGIDFLRNKCRCFWLIDIVESVQHLQKIKSNRGFLVWRIRINDDKSWIVDARTDTNQPILYEQKGKYTDFPLKEYEFYQVCDVIMLKSEW